ncbi:MAG: Isoquinoline 1-oxidoreductase alpha subunit [Proteobacteria bacterium]|nr:Isoquinoline 1-oxidoreductase alpha subunit [Pseudomonadota bacterium]
MALTLQVNGQTREVQGDAETPLLYALRNDLGLVGTRYGCGLGQCGACTVIIDGKPVQSCDITVAAVAGKKIITVEALGTVQALHPLQRAFIAEQAAQCGYCASGILMAAKALLDVNPDPSDADIRNALDGNLCRCGTHGRVLRAIKSAAAEMRRG